MDKVIRFNEHMCIVGFLSYAHSTGLIDTNLKVKLMMNVQEHLKEKDEMSRAIDGERLATLMKQLMNK